MKLDQEDSEDKNSEKVNADEVQLLPVSDLDDEEADSDDYGDYDSSDEYHIADEIFEVNTLDNKADEYNAKTFEELEKIPKAYDVVFKFLPSTA